MYGFGSLCIKTEVQIEIGRPLTVEMLLCFGSLYAAS